MAAESRPYVRPVSIRLVAAAVPVLAGVVALGGVVSMLAGLRRDDVLVPIAADFARLPGGGASLPVPAAGLPDGSYVEVLSPEQGLRVPGATPAEQLLARADLALVMPVLLALAEAFRRGAELADDVRGLV